MISKVRLTQLVTSAGCSAKLSPNILSDALKNIKLPYDEKVLVGFSGKDDAGVYKLNDEMALIQTTDFFTPIVDDPFTFGQIAVTNALSDVYAMGGTPFNALNIVAFPQTENINILKEILEGGIEKLKEANCALLGGHSIDIPTIVYGLSVTGLINPLQIKENNAAKSGDILVFTKKLGTGILSNVLKFGNLDEKYYIQLVNSMTRLNNNASKAMISCNSNACTDITGFGLAGHSMQMAIASKVVLKFFVNKLPIMEGVIEGIKNNFLTRGDKSNRLYTQNNVYNLGNINRTLEHVLYDPQTSGGLLISIEEKKASDLINKLKEGGDVFSCIIGCVESPTENFKEGSIIFDYTL